MKLPHDAEMLYKRLTSRKQKLVHISPKNGAMRLYAMLESKEMIKKIRDLADGRIAYEIR